MDNFFVKMLAEYLILLLIVTSCSSQRRSCSYDRMRQCQDGLKWNTEKRVSDMNRQDVVAHCANTREDFNCLLKETRCLSDSERQRNAETLRSAARYIKNGCDSQGGRWQDSSCYIGDGMKNCENSNPLGGSSFASFNSESCRKYQQFHDCVQDTLRSRCRPEDDRLLGLYLMDTAQDLAWNCSESDSDSRYGSNNDRYAGSDRYGGSDRTSDRDRSSDRDRYPGSSDRYPGSSDRYPGSNDRYPGGYDRNGGSSNRNPDRGYDRGTDRSDRNYGRIPGERNSTRSDGSRSEDSDITCCRYERCDRGRMQQCRDSLSRAVDNRMSGFQDSPKCRKARDDFNCLLWQNSCLNRDERDRNNDIFHKARDYFSKSCDNYGRWSENSCYKSGDMQRCENYLSNARSSADHEACRSFTNFRECAVQELQNKCTREDELLQGSYFVDKAQELSWTCPNDRSDDRNSYYPGDRRGGGGGTGGTGGGGYDRWNDNYPSYGSNDESYPHLDDTEAMCVSRVRYRTEACERELNETRRQLIVENNFDIKQKRRCCSARIFKSCLTRAVQEICSQGSYRRVVDQLLGQSRYILDSSDCRNLYENECSGSSSIFAVFMYTIAGALLSLLINKI